MTYRDLIKSSLATVCEDPSASFGVEDYSARAPFLLASFITRYAKLDGEYRKANGMTSKAIHTDIAEVDPEDDFPLCDAFFPAAINYLASGLVIDENEEMSDKFFDRYIGIILDIRNTLPAQKEQIVDRYGIS